MPMGQRFLGIFDWLARADFARHLVAILSDWRTWIGPSMSWIGTFFGASLFDYRDPVSVWIASLVAAALVTVIVVGWRLVSVIRSAVPEPKENTQAEPCRPGKGGSADAEGKFIFAEGGDAGESGFIPGVGPIPGGDGGNTSAKGEYIRSKGGAGGNAPQADGRGGRAAKGPLEILNQETAYWKYGRGGMGASAPEFYRRMAILTQLQQEYLRDFPEEAPFINSGIDPVPLNWVNKRLEELNETWRVTMSDGGYVLPPLESG